MQRIKMFFIERSVILFAVQCERSSSNPIRDATNGGPKVCVLRIG